MSKNSEMYEAISNKIITMLDNGVVPWNKPWSVDNDGARNIVSKKFYRGVNVWLLSFNGYKSPFWGTFNQIKGLGGMVKKGEKGTRIYFWSFIINKVLDEKGKPKLNEKGQPLVNKFPMLKEYVVFNADQCVDLKVPVVEIVERPENKKIEICESIVSGYVNAPTIGHGESQGRAFYRPSTDEIQMPPMNNFKNSGSYYATLFHEMGHSTGHKSRLNREEIQKLAGFGSHSYGREELVAEFCASYLCGVAGIENNLIENSVAYIQNWKDAIKADPALVMVAASKAQKAADHILGKDETNEED